MRNLVLIAGILKLKLPAPLLRLLYTGRRIERDGRRADPHAQVVGELAQALGGDKMPSLAQSRAQMEAMARKFDLPRPQGVATHDMELPGGDPGAEGPRPVRVYVPHGQAPDTPGPTLLYLHGGGWVQGGISSHDGLCGYFADAAGIRVISLDYRLAPEHPFPAAPDDVLAAYRALLGDGPLHTPAAQLAVGGDSAGGNLTAGLMHDLAEAGLPLPAGQLLIYPAVDGSLSSASMQALGDAFILPRARIDWFLERYVPDPADRASPRFSATDTPHLAGQPPALVIVAGLDPLRDEGLAHAEALRAAGVDVEVAEFPGQIHAFLSLRGVIPQGRDAARLAATWLERVLRRNLGRDVGRDVGRVVD